MASSAKKSAESAGARVQAYMAALPAATRRDLKKIRDAIRAAAPGAEEHFSYGIPGFRFEGRPLVWYGAFKSHTSLFPITANIQKAHAQAIEGYGTSKGGIRFPLDEEPPLALVKKLVKSRIAEVRAELKAKAKTKAKAKAR